MRDDRTARLAIAGILMSATSWGLVWYPYRWLGDMGMPGMVSTMITYLLTLLAGLPWLPGHWRNIRANGRIWLVLAILSGWTNSAYVLAVMHGEVMRVVLLFYLAPLWTVLFARLLLGERLTLSGYRILLLSFCGALVMLWQPGGRWPLPASMAEWLGLSAGMGFAFTNVLSRRMEGISIPAKSLAIWLGGVAVPALWMLAFPALAHVSMHGNSGLVAAEIVAVTASMFAVTWLMQYGLAHVAANRAIVVLLFELVVSALSSWWLAGETLVGKEWVGAAMIMAASLFSEQMEQYSHDPDSTGASRLPAGE